jgi:lysozyme family protein
VDQAKSGSTFPHNLGYYTEIPRLVRVFYKQYFWDIMNLDQLENQMVAEKIFDTGVNVGIKTVIQFLQRTLNAANQKGKLWPDIQMDGRYGPATTNAIIACEKVGRTKGLLAGLKVMQGAHYFRLMEKNQDLEEFYLGWLTRAME